MNNFFIIFITKIYIYSERNTLFFSSSNPQEIPTLFKSYYWNLLILVMPSLVIMNIKVTSYSFPSQSWVCPLKTSHGTFLCLAQESNLRHLACFRALWSECNLSAALNRKLFSHTNLIRSLTSILIGWKFTFTVNNVFFWGAFIIMKAKLCR